MRIRAYVLVSVTLFFAASASAAPVIINGVPDWNQPLTYAPAPDTFVQPFDPPPHVAQVANWCTPTAASNVMGWLEDQQGYNGLADGLASPSRQQPYPNNDTDFGAPDGLPDWQQNQWLDGTIELGYQMDTQGWNSNVAHFGTTFGAGVMDCPGGIQTYLNNHSALQWTVWNYDQFNGGNKFNSWNDYMNGGFQPTLPAMANVPNNGVFLGDPVLVTLDKWVNIANPNKFTTAGGIECYDWTNAVDGAHTVTGVGYALNWDPDGQFLPLPLGNWMIAHDGWATTFLTAEIAIPWDQTLQTNWWGNTHIHIPEPATMGLLVLGGLVLLRRRTKR